MLNYVFPSKGTEYYYNSIKFIGEMKIIKMKTSHFALDLS